jgi:hypothetical protein
MLIQLKQLMKTCKILSISNNSSKSHIFNFMHYITEVTYNLRPIQLMRVKKKYMEDISII